MCICMCVDLDTEHHFYLVLHAPKLDTLKHRQNRLESEDVVCDHVLASETSPQ